MLYIGILITTECPAMRFIWNFWRNFKIFESTMYVKIKWDAYIHVRNFQQTKEQNFKIDITVSGATDGLTHNDDHKSTFPREWVNCELEVVMKNVMLKFQSNPVIHFQVKSTFDNFKLKIVVQNPHIPKKWLNYKFKIIRKWLGYCYFKSVASVICYYELSKQSSNSFQSYKHLQKSLTKNFNLKIVVLNSKSTLVWGQTINISTISKSFNQCYTHSVTYMSTHLFCTLQNSCTDLLPSNYSAHNNSLWCYNVHM